MMLLFCGLYSVSAVNFPYELAQLTESEVQKFPAIAFGNLSSSTDSYKGLRCRVGPGDHDWPSDQEWAAFNQSLEGKLLKPVPPGAVCYPGSHYDKDKCQFVVGPAASTRFFLDEPVNVMTSWAEGNTCPPAVNATGNCTQGGYPAYVVNATTVKDVQMAINFARNKNLRVNIK